jgi:hypothetical protein
MRSAHEQPEVERRAGKCGSARAEPVYPRTAVANVSLIVALDKQQLTERVGKILRRQVDLVVA